MAFIDELIGDELPYGMEVEESKAHDEINRLTITNDVHNMAKDLVMGTMGGGGAGKGLRQLVLALKGKIKGGKMIPSQPIRKGTISRVSDAPFDIVKDSPSFKEQSRIFHQHPKVKKAMDDFINARGRFKRENVGSGEIDDILKSIQQSEEFVNYRPGFLQGLLDKVKKMF
jgi:hypothetical protein